MKEIDEKIKWCKIFARTKNSRIKKKQFKKVAKNFKVKGE